MGRRSLAVLVLLAAVTAAPARAGEPPPGEEPAPSPSPPVIAEGVTVAGVEVGGMTGADAEAAVQAAFDRPLRFVFGKRRWKATPAQLGGRAYVEGAVRRARLAGPGEEVELVVAVDGAKTRAYAAYLDRAFSRPARDSVLRLRRYRPFLTESRAGVDVDRAAMTAAIVAALRRHERDPLRLAADPVAPAVTRAGFGPIVVIRREAKRLELYRGMRLVRRFGVATGQSRYPTPLGRFEIITKWRNPTWTPPDSDWAEGLEPVPPGPGNPLGTRWMGISSRGVGIHGTPNPASIGYSASHGCVRMRIPEAEWLFNRVAIGTPVFVVRA